VTGKIGLLEKNSKWDLTIFTQRRKREKENTIGGKAELGGSTGEKRRTEGHRDGKTAGGARKSLRAENVKRPYKKGNPGWQKKGLDRTRHSKDLGPLKKEM